MFFLGIDIGSLTCDAVIINGEEKIIGATVVPTGARNISAIERARKEVLAMANLKPAEISGVIATGYGRDRVTDRLASVTEITCHAKGIQNLAPGTDLLIDIGGQDSKVIRFDRKARVLDFAMNDKCSAGTGRFLEAMARALEVDLEKLSLLDEGARGGLMISSMCTVFAESEVVSLVAEGAAVSEIVSGLNRAIAAKTETLVKRVASDISGLKVAMSGGVAKNRGVVKALEKLLKIPIFVPEEPDIVGALGAALIAKERVF